MGCGQSVLETLRLKPAVKLSNPADANGDKNTLAFLLSARTSRLFSESRVDSGALCLI